MNKLIISIMMSVLFSQPEIADNNLRQEFHKKPVVEVVLFEAQPQYSEEEVEKALASLNDVVKLYYGFIERTTGRNEEGKYIDIVYWTDMESAKKAAADIMKNPSAAAIFAVIKPESVQMFHFDSFNQYKE